MVSEAEINLLVVGSSSVDKGVRRGVMIAMWPGLGMVLLMRAIGGF